MQEGIVRWGDKCLPFHPVLISPSSPSSNTSVQTRGRQRCSGQRLTGAPTSVRSSRAWPLETCSVQAHFQWGLQVTRRLPPAAQLSWGLRWRGRNSRDRVPHTCKAPASQPSWKHGTGPGPPDRFVPADCSSVQETFSFLSRRQSCEIWQI